MLRCWTQAEYFVRQQSSPFLFSIQTYSVNQHFTQSCNGLQHWRMYGCSNIQQLDLNPVNVSSNDVVYICYPNQAVSSAADVIVLKGAGPSEDTKTTPKWAVREITKCSITFSATKISSNVVWLLQLLIQSKWNQIIPESTIIMKI